MQHCVQVIIRTIFVTRNTHKHPHLAVNAVEMCINHPLFTQRLQGIFCPKYSTVLSFIKVNNYQVDFLIHILFILFSTIIFLL